jgi:hypothetical protein
MIIGFLAGLAISVVAAVPSLLLLWGGKDAEMKQRLKLWAIGLAIRFTVIGGALLYLFSQTAIDRIPTVIGVAVAYFAIYLVETLTTLRT